MSAERGWIGQPQPQRTSIPGEERKWRIMMGNGQFLTEEDKDRLSKMEEYRRYIRRWCHLDRTLEDGKRSRRRTAKLEQDLHTAVQPPLRPPLMLAPRYVAGRPHQ